MRCWTVGGVFGGACVSQSVFLFLRFQCGKVYGCISIHLLGYKIYGIESCLVSFIECFEGGELDLWKVNSHGYADLVLFRWDREEIVYADLVLQDLTEARMDFDPVGSYSRPDVFELRVNERSSTNVTFV